MFDIFRARDNRLSVLLTLAVLALCAVGGEAYGLEFTSAVLDRSAGVLAVTFDEGVDPGSVDAAKFYIREQGYAAGGIALAGSAIATHGTLVLLTLTDAHMAALEGIDQARLTIGTAAITGDAGGRFDAAFDASTAFFVNSTSVYAARAGSDSLEFSNDGTKMFIGDYTSPIREYALDAAFDASTASFLGSSDELSDNAGYFAFSSDGLRLFVSLDDGLIGQYDMPVPFDIYNLTLAGSLDVSDKATVLYDIFIDAGGNNMFVADYREDRIHQYRLPTPFDLDGASHVASFQIQEGSPSSLVFGNGGTRMLVLNDKNKILQYDMPAAFNLTGASYDGSSVDLQLSENGNLGSASGLAFSSDGARMFITDAFNFTVAEYVLGTFGMEVTDDPAPRTLSIGAADPLDATTASLTLVFSVTFSEPVRNVDATDFELTGTGSGSITGLAGSGAQYLVTVLAVRDGTYNLDIARNSGIADASGNPLNGTDPTGADHSYLVRTGPPTVASIERSDPVDGTTSSQSLAFAVAFSEPVTGVDPGDFVLSPDAVRESGKFTHAREPSLPIPDGGGAISDAIAVPDSGQIASVTVDVNITHFDRSDLVVDLVAPDGTIMRLHDRTGSGRGDLEKTYTPDFDGAGIAGDWVLRVSDEFEGTLGTLNRWALTIEYDDALDAVTGLTGSGAQYLVTVLAVRDGTYNLDIARNSGIADASGNPLNGTDPTGADHSYLVRTGPPTVASIERSDPVDGTTSSQSLAFAVAFSEPVRNVDAADFVLSPDGAKALERYTGTRAPSLPIPDNDAAVSDTIVVDRSGTVRSVYVGVDITHTYASDLSVALISPDGTIAVLHNRDGGSSHNINQTYAPDFGGIAVNGNWTLRVNDAGSADTGTLNGWALAIEYEETSSTVTGSDARYLVTVSATQNGTYNLDVAANNGIADLAGNPLAGVDPPVDQSFYVTIVDAPPALAAIPDQAVNELSPLTFVASVTDGDLLAGPLAYGLDGGPRGAVINPATGAFEWTPTETQNGGHTITVTVSGSDGLIDSQDVAVTVNEANTNPVLDAIPDQAVGVLSTLTFVANATDGDRHPGVEVETVAANLQVPWSIDWTPEGAALFTERGGSLRVIRDGILASDPLLSLDVGQGEGGLLGIAVDPDFGDNRYIYLYYSTSGTDSALTNKVVRYQFANGTVTQDRVLIDGIPGAPYHDGGRIQFGPDGNLYISTGDAGNPALAQDLDSLAGKILRIDRDGAVPAGNPFADSPVWSIGHRNPQGMDWDTSGNLVAAEHGPSGERGVAHDEINVVIPGANYGWPDIVGGESAEGMRVPILHTGMDTWAPSGAEFYEGDRIPGWTGKYFVAALRGAHLHMVDLDLQNHSVVSHEKLFQDEFGRLRDVQTGPDGFLYVLTSNRDGRGSPVLSDDRILRIVAVPDVDRSRPANTLTYGLDGAPDGASIDPANGTFVWTPGGGLEPGAFTFNVTVSDGEGGTAARAVLVHVIGAPDAPQNLRANSTSDSVTLAWDQPDDDSITGYKVLSGGPADPPHLYVLVSDTNSTDAFHTVKGLEPSAAYLFGVVALSEHGESYRSDLLDVFTTAVPASTDFVTTWRTMTPGEPITIPVGGASGTYAINWGDGTASGEITGDQSHTYDAPGTYAVRISGDFSRIRLDGAPANAQKLQSIEQWGDAQWESMGSAFKGASNMVYSATDSPNLSGVTDISGMFDSASSFNGNLSDWDVSSVTNMSGTFWQSSFNGDLSDWDVSAATHMPGMFYGTGSFNSDLSAWDVSSVTDMSGMFWQSSFNGNLSDWDVSSVTNLSGIFADTPSFNGNLSDWDVSSVTNMRSMFSGAESFNGDLSDWDVSSATAMGNMFSGANAFDQNLGKWYIVLDSTSIDHGDAPGVVGRVSAQNRFLDWQVPSYGIGLGGDSGSFEMDGTRLMLKEATEDLPAKLSYTANITSAGGFGAGNFHLINVTVTNYNPPPTVQAGSGQTVTEGGTITLNGTATDDNNDDLTYLWSHNSTLDIVLSNAASPSTTLTAPQVDADTTIALTLSVDDGANTATDTLTLIITDVGAGIGAVTTGNVGAGTDFVTTWRTTTAGEPITIPVGGATGTYAVDWGDGTVSADVSGDQTHAYDDPGTHTVRISGDFTRIHLNSEQPNAGKIRSIEQWGDIRWESMDSAFKGTSQMAYRATDAPNLSGVTDMALMFKDSSFNGDISAWGVSSVTDMSYMFAGSSFNGDLSGWDVSSVQNMEAMFAGSSFNGDLPDWDVSSVTSMHNMFASAYSFNGDISGWDVHSVTDMNAVFASAHAFKGDLSGWDVSSVIDMNNTFNGAHSFNGDISDWDVSSATHMSRMFRNALSFNGDLSDWDVSSAANMVDMFDNATSALDQNLGKWYIVLDSTSIDHGDAPGVVGRVSAQNRFLDWQVPSYGIGLGGDSGSFEMDGTRLMLKEATEDLPAKLSYTANITSAGGFGAGNFHLINVTVTNYNPPPTVQAGPGQTVTEGGTITLNGTATDDNNDDLTYLWSHNSTLDIVLSNAASPSTTLTAPQVDADTTIALTLSVSDGKESGTDTMTVTVLDVPNRLPSVEAGDDQSVSEGATVSLAGSATDPDDATLAYSWSHDSALPITFANASSPSTAFTAPQVDENTAIILTLTVSDGKGSGTDTMTVTVLDVPNRLPSVEAGDDQSVNEGATVSLAGSATDPDDATLAYSWSQISGSPTVDLLGVGTPSPTFTAPQVFSEIRLVFELAVSDETDIVTDTVTITVNNVSSDSEFVTTWRTTSPNESVTIPVGGATGTYTVDWGDGSVFAHVTGDQRHAYADAGEYAVSISGDFTRIHLDGKQPNANRLQSIDRWGDIRWESMEGAFSKATKMTYVATDIPDLSQVASTSRMFENAYAFNGNLSSWNTSQVTDMSGMFRNALIFNGNLSSWNTSQVTDMSRIFENALHFNGDISAWNTSQVTDMSGMFGYALSFNGDISAWNTSQVTDMSGMFTSAELFNGDVSAWNVSGVADMSGMFDYAYSFSKNLGKWYIVPNSTSISGLDGSIAISAQSATLDRQNPIYTIDDSAHDGDKFQITGGNLLTLKDGQSVNPGQYSVTIKSTGSFGTGNSKTITVTVSDVPANSLPSVEAGDDQSVNEGATTNLAGSATDPDDATLTYSWSHDLALDIAFANASSSSTTFTAPQVDENTAIIFTLTVSDEKGSGTDTVTVTVLDVPANSLPSVEAGDDQSVNEGATTNLAGSATDPDDATLTYSWSHDSALDIIFTNATSPSTTFTAPQVDENTAIIFTLTASDGKGSGTDTVTVTVLDVTANAPPTVNAGADQIVQEGVSVTLTGNATDPDGDPLVYQWSHDSTLPITFANTTSPSTTFTAPVVDAETTVTITLTVSDDDESVSDTLTLTITDVPVINPIIVQPVPDTPQNLVANSTHNSITLTWDQPDDDSITGYKILSRTPATQNQLSTLVENTGSQGTSYTATDLDADTRYVFRVMAINESGESTRSNFVRISTSANTPPAIQPVPDAPQNLVASSTHNSITLTWDQPDDDSITGYKIFSRTPATQNQLSTLVENTGSQGTSYTATDLDADTRYVFRVMAINESGESTRSNFVEISTSANNIIITNNPPTVDAGSDQTVAEGGTVTLTGSAADADNDDLTYLWSHDSSMDIVFGSADSLSTTITAPQVDAETTVTVTLTASDDDESVSDTLTLTITDVPANSPPTVDAGSDQTVAEGGTVTLTGSAADADNDDLTYLWSHDSSMDIVFGSADSLSTTITAPQVDAETTVTVTLTASDDDESVSDTLTLTITDVPVIIPPAIQPVPDAPQNLVASSTHNSITLTWDQPDDDSITGYKILSRTPATQNQLSTLVENTGSQGTSYTATDLDADTRYVFRVMAINESGESTRSNFVEISTSANNIIITNNPPTVDAGSDQTVAEGGTVTLTGSAADADNDDLTYLWSHDSSMDIVFGSADSLSTTITAPQVDAETTVTVTLTASDDDESVSDTLTLTITDVPANSPPTVDAGSDQTVAEGGTVTLTGSAADADNDDLTYLWSHDSSMDIVFGSADSLSTTITAPQVDAETTVTVTLTASDDDESVSDTLTLTITDVPVIIPPAIQPVPDAPQNLVASSTHNSITLTWDQPDDDSITGYKILSRTPATQNQLSTLVENTGSQGTSYTATDLDADTRYVFRVMAINESGESTRSNFVEISTSANNIIITNNPPTVDAGSDQTVAEGGTVTLTGSAADADNDDLTYLWSHDSSLNIVFGSADSLSTTITAPQVDAETTVTVTLTVSDDDESVSDTLTLTITDVPANSPPTVDAGSDQTVAEGGTVTLTGSAADADNDDLTYLWSHDSSLNIVFGSADSLSTTITAPQVDAETTVTVTLTVSDDDESVSDTLALTITDVPVPVQSGTEPFITTWRTTQPNESITIPVGGADGTYTVDWGDGTVSADVSGDQTHAYNTPGTHTVKISGDFARIHLDNQQPNAGRLASIDQWGDIRWTSMESAFYGTHNMGYHAADAPNLTNVGSMSEMFRGTFMDDADLSRWDVSPVANMSSLFRESAFNGNVSDWDVSGATDMSYMFTSAASFNRDLDWNTSSVTDMSNMFSGAVSFDGDISGWDVSEVTDMSYMFFLAGNFDGDISGWDVSSVAYMDSMFRYASYFDGDLRWDVSSVTYMAHMFEDATSFDGDISGWDVSSVASMYGMFYNAPSFDGDISGWNVSSVYDMDRMFQNAASFDGDISGWNVSGVTDMFHMFDGATSFDGDISGWNVSGVTDMGHMFDGATDFSRNLGNWYIVLNSTTLDPGQTTVGTILAQNDFLRGQTPTYTVEQTGDGAKFAVNGNVLTYNSADPVTGPYHITIKSTGPLFGINNYKNVIINE